MATRGPGGQLSRRSITLTTATLAALASGVALSTPASAAGRPQANCPAAFAERMISEFNAGTQGFLRSTIDKNGDEVVCSLNLPEAVPFLPINFTDNVSSA